MTSIVVTNPSTTVVVSETEVTITVTDSGVVLSVAQGQAGIGVPSGGLTGEVLMKASNANYDTEWGLSDYFWSSPSTQILSFNGIEDPASVLSYVPLHHNFSTTYGSWVGSDAPNTVELTPAAIGGSVTYVNDTCVLSTNPTATVGNSRAEMRSEKPNNGPSESAATVNFFDHYWHFKANVQVTAYLAATQYVVGFYRTHMGPVIDNMVAFEQRSGNWWVVVVFEGTEYFTYDTGVSVTQQCELEMLHRGFGEVAIFFVNGVPLILAGLLPFEDYILTPEDLASPPLLMHQGVAVRDNNTPQTVISSITIHSMISKRTQNIAYLLGDCQGVGTANTVNKIVNKSIEQGTPSENDFLIYVGAHWTHSPAGNYLDLDGLGDVVIASPIERQNLQYDGTNWVNRKDSFYSTTSSDRALSSINTAQNVFPTTSDTIALDANSVWLVEGSYVIASGAVTHTTAIGFSEFGNGSCHFTTMSAGVGAYGTVVRAQDTVTFDNAIGGAVNAATTTALLAVTFSGRITVVDATNFSPTVRFSVSPTGTNAVKAGSWIKLTRLWTGTSTAADSGWT
jgi:hypothetical protein